MKKIDSNMNSVIFLWENGEKVIIEKPFEVVSNLIKLLNENGIPSTIQIVEQKS